MNIIIIVVFFKNSPKLYIVGLHILHRTNTNIGIAYGEENQYHLRIRGLITRKSYDYLTM